MPNSTLSALMLLFFFLSGCDSEVSILAPTQQPVLAAPSSNSTPVTTLVFDVDSAIAPTLQIRSDGLGSYLNSTSLTSVIQDIGAWLLDSRSPRNGTRQLYLDFALPIAGSGPGGGQPVPVPSALYRVRAIAKCNLYGTSMLSLAPGTSMACPLHIGFDFGGNSYAVQMNPYPSSGDPEGAPETNYVNITCTAPSSGTGPCIEWRITPSGTYPRPDGSAGYRNVGRLIKYVTNKGKTTANNQGDFYFSFAIRVTNP
jgi:hypothetical protein